MTLEDVQVLVHELSGTRRLAKRQIWEACLLLQWFSGVAHAYLLQMGIDGFRLFGLWGISLAPGSDFRLLFVSLLPPEHWHEHILARWLDALFCLRAVLKLVQRVWCLRLQQGALFDCQPKIGQLLTIESQIITFWRLRLALCAHIDVALACVDPSCDFVEFLELL